MQELITFKKCVTAENKFTYSTIHDLFNMIKSCRFYNEVAEHRRLYKWKNVNEYNNYIKLNKLPQAFMVKFKTSTQSDSEWEPTGLMCFDIDDIISEHLEQDLADYKLAIQKALGSCMVMCFISPSGDGLKFIIQTDYAGTCYREFRAVYEQILIVLRKLLPMPLKLDATKSVSCGVIVSSDEKAILNPDIKPLKTATFVKSYRENPELPTLCLEDTEMSDEGKSELDRRYALRLKTVNSEGRFNTMFNLMCDVRKCGGNKADAIEILKKFHSVNLMPRKISLKDIPEVVNSRWDYIAGNRSNDPVNVYIKMEPTKLREYKLARLEALLAE